MSVYRFRLLAMSAPPLTASTPSIRNTPLFKPSTCSTELVSVSEPPFVMMQELRISKGVLVPAFATDKVLVDPLGAPTVRLLMLIVTGKFAAVLLLIVTVFVLAFVIRMADSPENGAAPSDQFVVFSHAPLTL